MLFRKPQTTIIPEKEKLSAPHVDDFEIIARQISHHCFDDLLTITLKDMDLSSYLLDQLNNGLLKKHLLSTDGYNCLKPADDAVYVTVILLVPTKEMVKYEWLDNLTWNAASLQNAQILHVLGTCQEKNITLNNPIYSHLEKKDVASIVNVYHSLTSSSEEKSASTDETELQKCKSYSDAVDLLVSKYCADSTSDANRLLLRCLLTIMKVDIVGTYNEIENKKLNTLTSNSEKLSIKK